LPPARSERLSRHSALGAAGVELDLVRPVVALGQRVDNARDHRQDERADLCARIVDPLLFRPLSPRRAFDSRRWIS
jgi:hypothetical protein